MSLKRHLRVAPISRSDSVRLCEEYHYSGKAYPKSQVHLGVFWKGDLEGVMAYGCPIDRRKVLGLVEGTQWHEMCELNRMAFSPCLPKNSESRALAVSFRLFKKHAPHIKWLLSYADGAQSGSGAIYRATGWVLTQKKKNGSLYVDHDGTVLSDIGIRTGDRMQSKIASRIGRPARSHKDFVDAGLVKIDGYQYRYIKILDEACSLACDTLDYDCARG